MAGQMVMKIWSQAITDFREIWMKEIPPSSADLKLWWYVLVCSRWLVTLLSFWLALVRTVGWEEREMDVKDQSLQSSEVFTLHLTVTYLCFVCLFSPV